MTPEEVAIWLEEMWRNSPAPDSGEESYRYLRSRVERVVDEGREELISGLRLWLALRSEPKTMTAANLAADFHLTELRSELFRLLEDIEHDRTTFNRGLKLHYAEIVMECLSRI